jgi:hypothetical protein
LPLAACPSLCALQWGARRLALQANVWMRDRAGGATVLHYAAAAGHDGVVRLLAAHAAENPPPPAMVGKSLVADLLLDRQRLPCPLSSRPGVLASRVAVCTKPETVQGLLG